MVQIIDVVIVSIDNSDDSWEIEGEILFDGDLNTAFEALYIPDDDEFSHINIEPNFSGYDDEELKRRILTACDEFE